MDEPVEIRRKRLRFRSWHRGTREVDLLLGPFADCHIADFSAAELDRYEALLAENDATLYDWLTGRASPPPEQNSDILHLIMNFRFSPRPA